MAQLAIRGHATRGKEVIEILEMLGGKNDCNYEGDVTRYIYSIDEKGTINWYIPHPAGPFVVFTIEEFLEQYPYKIGDRVLYKTYGIYLRIKSMFWNEEKERVVYLLDSNKLFVATADELQPYKEETMEERNEKAVNHVFVTEVISFDIAQKDKYELDLQGKFYIVLREGKYYVERIKPKYPKTYEECCKVIGAEFNRHYQYTKKDKEIDYPHEVKLLDCLDNLRRLLICRDAYWKIAGEQMGLGEPWKFENPSKHYVFTIENFGGIIQKNAIATIMLNRILVFPTAEMRDAFLENFRDLIELCKELL